MDKIDKRSGCMNNLSPRTNAPLFILVLIILLIFWNSLLSLMPFWSAALAARGGLTPSLPPLEGM
jgi:hypothetical protein